MELRIDKRKMVMGSTCEQTKTQRSENGRYSRKGRDTELLDGGMVEEETLGATLHLSHKRETEKLRDRGARRDAVFF